MKSSVTNIEKKEFLKWFTKSYVLKRREALWILDYLYNHDIVLEKTHFVEDVKKTPRGIYMTVQNNENPAFRFYKNGKTFKDAMQAFHEVRLNWSSPLYIEIDFDDSWNFQQYLTVLEDNPYSTWNESITDELVETVEDALNYEMLLYARQQVMNEIDQKLATGDEKEFSTLTDELKEIDRKLSEMILKP